MTKDRQPPDAKIIPAEQNGVTVLYAHALLAVLAGLALRLLLAYWVPPTVDDSATYLQLARNWADHHVYGLWLDGHLSPTDLRMPGYPAFLAGVALLFGRATRAIVLSQVVLDLAACFLVAALARSLAPAGSRRRVAIAALWLAATCPFVATYAVAVLTEGPVAFLTTAALLCFAISLRCEGSTVRTAIWMAVAGAFLTGLATLMRPEMPLLFAAAGIVCAIRWWKLWGGRTVCAGALLMAIAFAVPLAPWTVRNFVVLHEFQPLAPRYVTMPGETAPTGYYAWTGTWLERYRDVYLNVWKIGEEPVDIADLPDSAFDSPQEKARIAQLFDEYNNSDTWDISPEMDAQFGEIARERTRRHPFRTYVTVPFQRALTIWFTPRTEMFPVDGKLWPIAEEWDGSPRDYVITLACAILGYAYVALALCGIWVAWRARFSPDAPEAAENSANWWGIALILLYCLLRTAFLTTVEAPEPRYVVTVYPAVLALAALFWSRTSQRSSTGSG